MTTKNSESTTVLDFIFVQRPFYVMKKIGLDSEQGTPSRPGIQFHCLRLFLRGGRKTTQGGTLERIEGKKIMLDSKKRMSQSYSDLKLALEKGRGDPQTIFQDFEKASRDFLGETGKVPREVGDDFLKQVARLRAKIKAGDLAGALEEYGGLKDRKKSCHNEYKG